MHLKSILSATLLSAALLQAGSVSAATFTFEFTGVAGDFSGVGTVPGTVTGTFSLPDVMNGTDLEATDMVITGFGNTNFDSIYGGSLPLDVTTGSATNAFTLDAGEIVSAIYDGVALAGEPFLALSNGPAFLGNWVCDYGSLFLCIGGQSTAVTFSEAGAMSSVPLPAGGLMLLAGLGGLAAARRVQKTRS